MSPFPRSSRLHALLAVGLLLTATACGNDSPNAETPNAGASSADAPTSSAPDSPSREATADSQERGAGSGTARGAGAASARAAMTTYLEASRDKDAEALCRVASDGTAPLHEDAAALKSCVSLYGVLLGAAPGEEGYAEVGVIVEEATRALAAGPSRVEVEGDTATFVHDDRAGGREVTLARHGEAWYVVLG